MVFPEILYRLRALLCGASGAAADLVAAWYVARLEDRTYNRDPCGKLDIVQINFELYPNNNRVLQDAWHDLTKGKKAQERALPFFMFPWPPPTLVGVDLHSSIKITYGARNVVVRLHLGDANQYWPVKSQDRSIHQ